MRLRFPIGRTCAVLAGPRSFLCWGPGYRSSKVGTQNPGSPSVLPLPKGGVLGLSSKGSSLGHPRLRERFLASLGFGAEPLLGRQVSWCYFRERWKRSSRLVTRAKEFRAGASPRACPNPKGGMKVNVLRAAVLGLVNSRTRNDRPCHTVQVTRA